MLNGWRGARDFGEAPSQLLEHWCWEPRCLQGMSCHYSYLADESRQHWLRKQQEQCELPPKQIPRQMIADLVAARYLNECILTSRQVGLSIFDMQVHNPSSHEELEALDIGAAFQSTLEEYTQYAGPDDGSIMGNGHSTTTHFMWGQEANYYSYVSTRMLAADMWKTCFRDDPMNKAAALRYRHMILDKGGSVDEAKMVADFLGREPNSDAFLENIGVKTT